MSDSVLGFFFFFLRICGSVCSVGLAVGLAYHGLGSVSNFFCFQILVQFFFLGFFLLES